MKITDKMRLDWLDKSAIPATHIHDCQGWIVNRLEGKTIRKAIDINMRRERKRKP